MIEEVEFVDSSKLWTALFTLSLFLPVITTAAPALIQAFAIANPIPLVPPVIKTFLLFNNNEGLSVMFSTIIGVGIDFGNILLQIFFKNLM